MDKRQTAVINALEKEYAGAQSALLYDSPFELLLAVMLSAQCTDKQVNTVTRRLFLSYNSPAALDALPLADVETLIRGCGLFRAKAKNIKATCRILLDEFAGQVPDNAADLMKLPGVGRKTANVVLSQAFGQSALAVDTHVLRVARRLGLASGAGADTTEKELCRLLPRHKWSAAHHWLIWHGRLVCKARRPLCAQCALLEWCPEGEI